jgi:C-terminal processing protease CtpA/Prc
MLRIFALVVGLLVGPALTTAVRAGEPPGWFGISLNVDAGGNVLSPTINSAKIIEVVPNSPAASVGLHTGDELVAVAGLPVSGGKARALQAALAKKVGESVVLRLKRPNGETYTAVVTAAPKPGRSGST